ncbi:MAG: hypothetical protein KBT47_01370 [Armatimonadetes bacterium]|nr:hypothetical protein [Candidatus Hippobium faecium]
MKKLLAVIFILMFSLCVYAEFFDYENDKGQEIFEEVYHEGDLDGNIHLTFGDKYEGSSSLVFESNNSGSYYYRTVPLKTLTEAAEISFWVKFGQTDLYSWYFELSDPEHKNTFMRIYEGVANYDNVIWGMFRYIMPDGSYFNLQKTTALWTKITVQADFSRETCDIYFNDVPAMMYLPMNMENYNGEYSITFGGYSAQGQKPWYLDYFSLHDSDSNYTPERPVPKSFVQRNQRGSITLVTDKRNGSITSLMFGREGIFGRSYDMYKFESEDSWAFSDESDDKVTDMKISANRIVYVCENEDFPGIFIKKTYEIHTDNSLTKNIEFENKGTKGFITWYSLIDYDREFFDSSYPAGFVFPADNPAKLTTLNEKGCRVGPNLGVGLIRETVNNRYVMNNKCESYTGSLFKKVYSDYLSLKSSAQVRYVFFSGDWTEFEKIQTDNEEYRKLFEFNRPDWLKNYICDDMYLQTSNTDYDKKVSPLFTTAAIWFLNPAWGNWGSESDPPKSLHPDVKGIAEDWRKTNSNAKVSSYTNTLFDINSDIYKMNDAGFFVFDREGNKCDSGIPSDAEGVPTYNLNITDKKARKYWIDMHRDKLKNWKLDYFYMDGPGAYEELADWKSKKVIENYDWLDYYRELKNAIMETCGEEGVYFTNGIMPFGDVGYIEWRDREWKELGEGENWQFLAKELFNVKLNEAKGYTVCPTYGDKDAQPYINAYSVCYGWLGNLPNTEYIPWHLASLEMRGLEYIDGGIKSPWWNDPNAEAEVYAFRKGENIIINALPHKKQGKKETVLDLDKLGIDSNKEYFVLSLSMNNPNDKSERAFEIKEIGLKKTEEKIYLDMTAPLSALIISPTAALVLHTGAHPAQTFINDNYGVKITQKGNALSIESEYDNAEIFIPFAEKIKTDLPFEKYNFNDVNGIKVSVPEKGIHTVEIM